MNRGVILAIETSQREGGIALRDRDGSIHIESLSASLRHDDDLMPAIERLFARCQLAPRDLEAVCVSIGPGGFTGLRIAIATAKMFALALDVAVVAVPSAVVAAASSLDHTGAGGKSVLVTLAAKGETLWATRLESHAKRWQIVGSPGLISAEHLDPNGCIAVLGDRYLPDSARSRCRAAGVAVIEPRFDPAACLRLGIGQFERGETTEAAGLLPLYARVAEATTIWEARHARSRPSDR